ncbi:Wzz/FepE/Etk N-terminal domain-containing protein [Streptomyces sp. NPDC050738]|uniref:Wzz/FepE/Etk N-terminal domain-containing protein n=1 Tax=Streptomyces sp. NPDC050738 TaxID=3154744 RepID=UPI00344067B7
MSDDTIRLVTIGRMFRWRWRFLVIVAIVGALVGYGASVAFPPRYTASASVLLPGQWEERQLLTQVDIATSSTVIDRTADKLGWNGVSGSELRDQVGAKAADGNIITISGTAETPERAQQLADLLAKEFVTFAARFAGGSSGSTATSGLDDLRKQVVESNRRITELAKAADPGQSVESVQARTALQKLSTSLEEAMTKLNEADPATAAANMAVMGPAARPTGEAPPTKMQLVVGGALLFFLLGIVGHLVAARMDRRLRTEQEIAAALGSSLLGIVEVPEERHAHQPQGSGPWALVRRVLGADTRWDEQVPQRAGDEAGRRIRYRRVYARVRDQRPDPRRLLTVVPQGDEIALRAAEQLVAEAGNDTSSSPSSSSSSSSSGNPMLRVVEVSVDRPTVPDRDTESGALVVLSAGSWTAEELAGIAEACADARQEVVGIVVADRVRALPGRSGGQPPDHAAPALAGRGQTTGGSA